MTTVPKLLTMSHVLERLEISRTTLWKLSKRGAFPAPVRISAFAVRWREDDVARWVSERQAGAGAAA